MRKAKLIYRTALSALGHAISPDDPSADLRRPLTHWWSQTGSNRRPHACKARALPTELWPRTETGFRRSVIGADVFRSPISETRSPTLVGLGGLEPPTSRLSSARSNQLSYKPGGGSRSSAIGRFRSLKTNPGSSDMRKKERRRRRRPA